MAGLMQDECEGYETQRLSKWFASRIDARHTIRKHMTTATTTLEYTYYTDPGHGWLAVAMEELELLGIKDQVSNYSYRKDGIAYLEEDCDMALFMNAMASKGVTVTLKNVNEPRNDSNSRSDRRVP